MRKGFSLVEALIALVIFAFGILAIVATSEVTARDLGIAQRQAHALVLARERVGGLHATACVSPAHGTALGAGGFLEHWRVEIDGARRLVSDSVVFAVARRRQTDVVVRAAAICP
jgi:hypothetical protein